MNDSKDLNVDELLTMLEEMQDQNDILQELLKTEKEKSSEAQGTISNLSSENSLLRNTLQQKSETIVSLNERIGMLQGSDKVLEENLSLRKNNSELQEMNSRIKREAEAKVAAAKEKAADVIAVLSDREKRVLASEKIIKQRLAGIDKEAESLADVIIQNRAKKIEAHFDASVKQISAKYAMKTTEYRAIMLLSVLYGSITIIIPAIKSKTFVTDILMFFKALGNSIVRLIAWSFKAGTYVASYGDKIPHPIAAGIMHWILLIIVMIILVGGFVSISIITIIKYISYFKEKQTDEISACAGLISLAVAVFGGDIIKTILPVNSVVLSGMLFIMYSIIRGIVQMENENVRSNILKLIVVSASTVAGIALMIHFFGAFGIMAVPIGFLLTIGNY